MFPRKYIIINKLKIAYSDIGEGDPILIVHSFGSSTYTWNRLISHLPKTYRFVMLDLKGFGYSDKSLDNHFSPLRHSKIVAEFAAKLKLKNIILVGHGYGGAIALLSLFKPAMKDNIKKIILLDSAGLYDQLPPFIKQLRIPFANKVIFNHINSEILIRVILEETFYDKNKISDEDIAEYSSQLRLPGATDCLIQNAQQVTFGQTHKFENILKDLNISVPVLLIWGEHDAFIPQEYAYKFQELLSDSKVVILPECGHMPQEEDPVRTAEVITAFLANKELPSFSESLDKNILINNSASVNSNSGGSNILSAPRPRLRNLIDKWTPTIFLLFVFVKILQVFKALGLKAKGSGWRKTMGTYLRTEHSKFGLAVFGLDYLSDIGRVEKNTYKTAKEHVIARLYQFLKDAPPGKWKLRWEKFIVFREKHTFVDIIDLDFDNDGYIKKLIPYFDKNGPEFLELNKKQQLEIAGKITEEYNLVKNLRDQVRPRILRKNLKRWVNGNKDFSQIEQLEAISFIDRVISGNFICFKKYKKNVAPTAEERFTPPDFINHKHAGMGLLNIICRFNYDMDEVDFWFQFQHVPVDGVPMQEFLMTLKKRWGIRRELVYPALKTKNRIPPQRCSTVDNKKALYQAITFLDFRSLLKLRKELNKKYCDAMGGPATVISLIMWGITQHPSLKDRKFIFPVELAECKATGQERAPSAMFIRPSAFLNKNKPKNGFFDFEFEFNRRMNMTRARKSESYELIEIYALLFPFLYTWTRKLLPGALGEFVGTVGITIIKDADLFITPLSDIQSDGFFAVGNLLVPTEDGEKAGCVSIRAPKNKMDQYLEAFAQVPEQINKLFDNRN